MTDDPLDNMIYIEDLKMQYDLFLADRDQAQELMDQTRDELESLGVEYD
jgi:hypothetical protein